MEPSKPKRKKTILRYGMRVRVTDRESFYYGLTGTLTSLDPDMPFVFIELDLECEEDEQDSHPVHMDTVTPLRRNDPDYEGVHFEEDEEDEDDEDLEDEIEEAPMLIPLTGGK